MKYIILVLKGFIIGIAKILPGISGAIISISLGVYERLISIIGNPLRINFDDLKFLFSLFVGAFFGILFLCDGVLWCLSKWKFATMMIFLGLIVGGSSDIFSVIQKKCNLKNISIMFSCFALSFLLSNLGGSDNGGGYYLLMGSIESLTTIIPGISGTAIFMSLGWYENLLLTIKKILSFTAPLSVFFKFIIGYIVSAIMISKLLSFLFKNYKTETYFCIFGFLFYSILSMFISIIGCNYSFNEFIFGLILFVLGYYLSKFINCFFSNL